MESLLSVFRISQAKYIRDLSGKGAEKYGGRWNRPGLPVLYTSQSRSLCTLELIVHFNSKASFKREYEYVEILVPESDVIELDEDLSGVDFRQPNNPILWEFTDELFSNGEALCLKVPSVLVPEEYNYLLNPTHPQFEDLTVVGFQPALLDNRFLSID